MQVGTLLIALTPQYPTFFATLSKDTWNCLGLIYLTWASLRVLRTGGRNLATVALLAFMSVSAAFAGAMRPNTVPAIAVFMLLAMAAVKPRVTAGLAAGPFVLYLALAVAGPRVALYLSAESEAARNTTPDPGVGSGATVSRTPLGAFADIYLNHLFGAAVQAGVEIAPEDAALFYKMAPPAAWKAYDCIHTDSIQIALGKGGEYQPGFTPVWSEAEQPERARVILKLLIRHPEVLVARQACITRLLWYIGYQTVPLQATATLGYVSVSPGFVDIAGGNRSLLGETWRGLVGRYVAWSQEPQVFWIFWKPFLYCCLGLFVVLVYPLAHRKTDVLVVGLLPLLLTLTLAVAIPFPAYRYQFPATLLFVLLFFLAFARPSPADSAATISS